MFEIQANELIEIKELNGNVIGIDASDLYWKIVGWEESKSASEVMDLLRKEISQPDMGLSFINQIYWEIIRLAVVRDDDAKKKIGMTHESIANSQDSIQAFPRVSPSGN